MRCFPFSSLVLGLLFSSAVAVAAGGVGLNTTRVIYPENAKSVTVSLRNTDESQSYLVKASLSADPEVFSAVPFVITPPIFRMEPSSTNLMRIAFKGGNLPQDRESVFYLKTTAIPSYSAQNSRLQNNSKSAMVSFATASTVKFFYRPAGLADDSESAQKNLKFFAVEGGIKVENSSPYFVSFQYIKVNGKTLTIADDAQVKMLSPFSSKVYSAKERQGKVDWVTIGDYGGYNIHSSVIK
ncbi:molecular chaperone [Serratia microhaemolytica]|uniref:fimbrial biogenesis chaperone n=1 Tax=Serratia microhaemolytica TaxID=2675110 RepID=UPI000FDF0A01|nr:molecular chaperone [Serratia microhaemolytica]